MVFNPNYPRKLDDSNGGLKRWRLIVRNLDDYTTREELETMFSRYGKLREIVLPKSKIKEGACARFSFIQFASRESADKARTELHNSSFKGRKITVEIAVNKDTYVTKKVEEKEKAAKPTPAASIKFEDSEDSSSDEEEVKKTVPVSKKPTKVVKKPKPERKGPLPELEDFEPSSDDDDDSTEDEEKDVKPVKKEEIASEDEEEEEDSDTDMEDLVDEDDEPPKKKVKNEGAFPKKKPDSAVAEGRVVFLRQLPFECTEEHLREAMEPFGIVTLAIPVMMKGTDRPSGTAFVHFKDKDSADSCLEQAKSEEGITIGIRRIVADRAVSREDATKNFVPQKKEPKDKRNLYLLRASIIRPDKSMSQEDAVKRSQLIENAKHKLKNLHMFVSPTRLSIQNVPYTMSEHELRKICIDAVGNPRARLTECRIMRQTATDASGKKQLGRSKGFAFVDFAEHSDAFQCLQKMNNNKDLFKPERRPIVEFSIENMAALRLKEQRLAKSKEWVDKPKSQRATEEEESAVKETKRKFMKPGSNPLPKKYGPKIRQRDGGKKGGPGGGGVQAGRVSKPNKGEAGGFRGNKKPQKGSWKGAKGAKPKGKPQKK